VEVELSVFLRSLVEASEIDAKLKEPLFLNEKNRSSMGETKRDEFNPVVRFSSMNLFCRAISSSL